MAGKVSKIQKFTCKKQLSSHKIGNWAVFRAALGHISNSYIVRLKTGAIWRFTGPGNVITRGNAKRAKNGLKTRLAAWA